MASAPRRVDLAASPSATGDAAGKRRTARRARASAPARPGRAAALLALATAAAPARGDGACNSRFEAPGSFPSKATEYNGRELAQACFQGGGGSHHAFVIGGWGGVVPAGGGQPSPADYEEREPVLDDARAQQHVARAMAERASSSSPNYVLNVGGNFHKTGIGTSCGAFNKPADTSQWADVFENMYDGDMQDVQWLGVLGTVDYGGYTFTAGWDQQIAYTWERPPPWSGRWMLPAQYYNAKAVYNDFSVEYFFLDSNRWSAYPKDLDPEHNICGERHAEEHGPASCAETGPASLDECEGWFKSLWDSEMTWLKGALKKSNADWQVVITHVQPDPDQWDELAKEQGIDIFLTGGEHFQEVLYLDDVNALRPTAVVTTGGGGGVISQKVPRPDGNDFAYGFVDLTLSKNTIKVDLVSRAGMVVDSATVHARARGEEYDQSKDYSGFQASDLDSSSMSAPLDGTTVAATTKASTTATASPAAKADAAPTSPITQAPSTSSPTSTPKPAKHANIEGLEAIGSDGFDASLETGPCTPDAINDTVVFRFVAENIDYSTLAVDQRLSASLVDGLRQVVGSEAQVESASVDIELSEGSLGVKATIHPGAKSVSEIRVALASSQSFGVSLSSFFHELDGIGEVATGEIKIRPAGAPTVIKAPRLKVAMASPAGAGSLVPGLPDIALWSGIAGAATALFLAVAVCLFLGRRSSGAAPPLPISTQDEPHTPIASSNSDLDSRPNWARTPEDLKHDPDSMQTRINPLLTRRPPTGGQGSLRPPPTATMDSGRSAKQAPNPAADNWPTRAGGGQLRGGPRSRA